MVTGDTGSAFDVTIPLTTAPTAGDDIDGTQYFPPATGSTFGVGVHGDDTELNRLLKGTTCMELKLSAFKSREVMVLTAELECATWAGNQTFTAPSTIAPSDPAICDDGPGLQLTDSTDALWSPCEGEVTCNLGVSKKWKLSAGGVGGYCGVVDVLGDGTVEATLYQDGTLSKLEALLESSGPIVLQAGEDDGTVVGVYVPDATISVYPTPDNIDTVNTIKVSWMSAQGILYRA